MQDHYRQAASILLLKPRGQDYEILLLHKPRKNDAWQLPQGGVEAGENIEQAALRELNEEAGITGAKVLGKSEQCYQYDFPASYRRFRKDSVCGQCIHYVYALAPDNVQVTVDEKEVNEFVWVTLAEMEKFVKREAYRKLVQGLYSEALALLE